MRDRREEILVRLEAIFNAIVMVPAIVRVARNQFDYGDPNRPAIIILDADELSVKHIDHPTIGLRMPPQMVAMSPQIFYLAGDLPENISIGTHINLSKNLILNAIFTDQELRNICGKNGRMYYASMETDMKTGSSIEGQTQINPVFIYPLLMSELNGV